MKKIIFGLIVITLAFSSCFSAKTEKASTTNNNNTTTMTAPTGVTASKGTYADQVVISWNAVSGASYYNLYRATSSTGTPVYIGYVTATSSPSAINSTTSPTSYPIDSYTTYYYAVTSEDSNSNESDLSSIDYGYITRASLKIYNYSSTSVTTFYAQFGTSYPYSYTSANKLGSSLPGSSSIYYRFAPANYINFYVSWGSGYWVSSDGMISNYPGTYTQSSFLIASNDTHTIQTGSSSSGTNSFIYYTSDYGVKFIENSDDESDMPENAVEIGENIE